MIAKVLIDLSAKEINQLYDYIIPNDEIENIKVGMRVYVPFGHMQRLGFVMELVETSNYLDEDLKTIIEVLDLEPIINEEQLLYVDYLNKINYGLKADVIKTILPKELFLNYYQLVTVNDSNQLSQQLKNVFNNKLSKRYNKELKPFDRELRRLKKIGAIKVTREYENRAKLKYVNVIKYNSNHNYGKVNNYLDLIDLVKSKALTKSEIEQYGFSISSINTLLKNEVFYLDQELRLRDVKYLDTEKVPVHVLNSEQELAYQKIIKGLNSNQTFLLKGITGSGKTEVYMHVIKEVLKQNKNVLYLIPEISMVAQTVKYLKSRFNVSVTHYNSSLSSGERFDAWYQISENKAKIVVGTRSSSFLPIQDLGIIIVDEEHDSSYNQVASINYELIDILNIKKDYFNIPLLLGSATPKITSMYYAKNKKYQLLELTKMATKEVPPKITYVDMKEELKNGNLSIFSKVLKNKIKDRLSKGEQVILLYNRLGYSSFVLCRSCGYVPSCPNCDISLTYYKEDQSLRCSHCNHKEPMVTSCPKCNSDKINTIGMGVDQVLERVSKEFSEAKILKMDSSSAKNKGNLESIWLDFSLGKADILVGTKMVSKGLDFPKVTLVGILMADLELKTPTYLASEQTYQMLKQMVGRSGRHLSGEAVIQGYDLNNPAIKLVSNNYMDFYNEAIVKRELLNYPPFMNIYQILISNESYLKAYQDSLKIKKALTNDHTIVLGPSEPYYKYLNNQYRFVITIKTKEIDYQKTKDIFNKYHNSTISFYNHLEII